TILWDRDLAPEGAALRLPLSHPGARVAMTNTAAGYLINFVPDQDFVGLTTKTYCLVDQVKLDAGRFKAAGSYLFFNHLNSGLHSPLFVPDGGVDAGPPTDAFLLRSGIGLQNTNNRYPYGPNAAGFGNDHFHILNLTGQLLFGGKR